MFAGSFPTFRADFHSVHDENRLAALIDHAVGGIFTPRLEAGNWVQIRDEESGNCLGLIEDILGTRLSVKLDWSTWTPMEPYRVDDFEILDDWFTGYVARPTIGAVLTTTTAAVLPDIQDAA